MGLGIKEYLRKIPLLRNIKYLMTHNLVDRDEEIMWNSLKNAENLYLYEFDDDYKSRHPMPHILNSSDTVKLLLEKPKSYCRFGDGEVMLMQGKSIPFQRWSPQLSQRLLEAMTSERDDLYVGIPYSYFHSTDNMNEYARKFHLLCTDEYKKFFLQHINLNRIYINTGFNQEYMLLQDNPNHFCKLYSNIKRCFFKKKVVVVAGENVIESLSHSIYDNVDEFHLIKGPVMNAFDEYDALLDKIHKFSTEYLICLQVGPTSKVLAHELTKEGYMAWDVGHLAQDYDAFCKKIPQNIENIQQFFEPDDKVQ